MRKITVVALTVLMCLSLVACGAGDVSSENNNNNNPISVPTTDNDNNKNDPESVLKTDYEYNINDLEFFSDIFDNNPQINWEERGSYTILINGLDTPVVFSMEGMVAVSVTAYGHTVDVNIDTFQGYSPVEIDGADDVIVVSEELDYSTRCWLITKETVFPILPISSISTRVFTKDDGGLYYRSYWGEYVTSFEQWDTAPLDLCKSRQQFLYEDGSLEIKDGELVFTREKTVTVSDELDLDSMFEEAKENGMYEEYDTVDQLLDSNLEASQEE